MKFILKHFGKTLDEIQLEEGREYLLGRHKDCDVVLKEEVGISRHHIKIYQSVESGNWIIESLSTLGGLYLEGEELQGLELEDSVSVNLRNYVLEFIKEKEEGSELIENPQKNLANLETLEDSKASPEVDLEGKTSFLSDTDLIYSLYIHISGEISDHISLNEEQSWIVGRSEECDISIDYSILTRKHLKIFRKGTDFFVEDLESSNSTFLNDKELLAHKPALLKVNDEISVSDLKMVFEVRNKNFEKIMNQLPAIVSEGDSSESENLPEMVFPKVILEEDPSESEEDPSAQKKSFLNKKNIFLLIVSFITGFSYIMYSNYQRKQKEKQKILALQNDKENQNKLEIFYKDALDNLDQKRYQLCLDHLEELHNFSTVGYFKDSQQLRIQCQNGLESFRKKEEFQAQEKVKKETELKIKKISDDCRKKFDARKIQTEGELNVCAVELLGGLDPANKEISSMRLEIIERATLKSIKDKQQTAYRNRIQSKRNLYNKAQKLQDQNHPLLAIAAYEVFLKSAKGISSLKNLYDKASSQRGFIQKNYNEELEKLYSSCKKLISDGKMKEAYYDCKKILKFRSEDKLAKQFMKQARESLQVDLKPVYEDSMFQESLAEIANAKKLWEEILAKDIKEGHYYEKAQLQINRYK